MFSEAIDDSVRKFYKKLFEWAKNLTSLEGLENSDFQKVVSYLKHPEHADAWAQKFSVHLCVAMTNKLDRVNQVLVRKEIINCIIAQTKWKALTCLPFIPEEHRERFLKEIDPLNIQHLRIIENGLQSYSLLLFLRNTYAPFCLSEQVQRTLHYRSLEIEIRKLATTFALLYGIKIEGAVRYNTEDSMFFDLSEQATYDPDRFQSQTQDDLLALVEETQNYFKSKFES